MQRRKLGACAAVIALCSLGIGTASAAVFAIGVPFGNNSTPVTTVNGLGPFSDTYTFTAPTGPNPLDAVFATVFNFNNPPTQNIFGLQASLQLIDTTTMTQIAISALGVGDPSEGLRLSPRPVFITPGSNYEFIVTGNVLPNDHTGAYDLNTFVESRVSAVPELSTWAMMLVGFGLVGLQVRRKSRSAVATA
jgi:hypothetical protein